MAIAQCALTLDAFLELAEAKPALEYFDGKLSQTVTRLGEHSVLQGSFVVHLEMLLRPRRLGRAFPELRTTYAGTSSVPDVVVYRQERVPRTPSGRIASRFRAPPDIAIEIRSPGQTLREL